ncbi:hypothetical protein [Tsuneonella sp. HG222]
MAFVTIRHSDNQTMIVNVDQITHMSHDIYGTNIFFSSGEHIVCPEDIDSLTDRLFGSAPPESLLIAQPRVT